MPNFKTIYFCVAGNGSWGKSEKLHEALKIAYVTFENREIDYIVTCMNFKEEITDEQLEYALVLWYVNDFGGINFCSDLNKEDEKLISDFFVGYSYIHNNKYKELKAKKKAAKAKLQEVKM